MNREIITIDEEKCDGCGLCITACHEGALQLIDGKARLVKDSYCDGLGNCLGECPRDAITIEVREADPFDEAAVALRMAALKNSDQAAAQPQASPACGCPGMKVMDFATPAKPAAAPGGGCPGARARSFSEHEDAEASSVEVPSQLRQWPVQLALVPPSAPYLENADLLVAADCVAYAHGNFHSELLNGRKLLIACPKLDDLRPYLDKMTAILQANNIRSITVARMEVPCCGGIVSIMEDAFERSGRDIPFEVITVGVRGDIVERAANSAAPATAR